MPAIGGSIESVSLDGRLFAVAADAEVQRKLGGFENEVQANGNSTARIVKTAVPSMLDGLAVEIDDTRGDHEFLQSLADSNDYFPTVITYASGESYQGAMMITGELQVSSQNTTATFSLMGSQPLTKQ